MELAHILRAADSLASESLRAPAVSRAGGSLRSAKWKCPLCGHWNGRTNKNACDIASFV